RVIFALRLASAFLRVHPGTGHDYASRRHAFDRHRRVDGPAGGLRWARLGLSAVSAGISPPWLRARLHRPPDGGHDDGCPWPALDWWPPAEGGYGFTSIGAWRGSYDPVEYGGKRYGLRVHEFRRFVELPSRTRASFEAALDIDAADEGDAELLRRNSWTLVPPRSVTADPYAYRRYIQGS